MNYELIRRNAEQVMRLGLKFHLHCTKLMSELHFISRSSKYVLSSLKSFCQREWFETKHFLHFVNSEEEQKVESSIDSQSNVIQSLIRSWRVAEIDIGYSIKVLAKIYSYRDTFVINNLWDRVDIQWVQCSALWPWHGEKKNVWVWI